MDWIEKRIGDLLDQRKSKGNLRELIVKREKLVDFVSNDYLGLSRSKKLHSIIQNRCEEADNGSGASRLLSGNSSQAVNLENKLARLFKAESALLFNSGYHANQGLLSTIATVDDTIFYDQLSHACIKDGIVLSKATAQPFRHNDLTDLEQKLSRCNTNKFVVVESIYSMDGDKAPLSDLTALCKQFDARLIVDEAHSTGIIGENGNGLVNDLALSDQVFARIHTFGKAMGVHGACVCGSSQLRALLVNFCRPFIYTTALPPYALAAIDAAFDYLNDNIWLQKVLRSKMEFFQQEREKLEFKKDVHFPRSDSAIQPVIIPGNERVKSVANRLQQQGFDCRPVLSPTVGRNKERLRICLHVHNTEEQIKGLLSNLSVLT